MLADLRFMWLAWADGGQGGEASRFEGATIGQRFAEAGESIRAILDLISVCGTPAPRRNRVPFRRIYSCSHSFDLLLVWSIDCRIFSGPPRV